MLIHTRNGRTIIKLGACEGNGRMKLGGTTNTRLTAAPPTPRCRMQKQSARPETTELSVEAILERRHAVIEDAIKRNYIEASRGNTAVPRPSPSKTAELTMEAIDAIWAKRKADLEAAACGHPAVQRSARLEATELSVEAIYTARKSSC